MDVTEDIILADLAQILGPKERRKVFVDQAPDVRFVRWLHRRCVVPWLSRKEDGTCCRDRNPDDLWSIPHPKTTRPGTFGRVSLGVRYPVQHALQPGHRASG